ncbi:MAG: hypothetical protein NUV35_05875 [Syntrophomonadaceae bacterium]|jgi:hypothetical protein|nr:hypothetical protein [Syntrophomonadaceae bacterium]
MVISLLAVTFLIALSISFAVERLFHQAVAGILARIIPEELSRAWHRYLSFAMYVVGVSRGVPIGSLENYIIPYPVGKGELAPVITLTSERWALEIYRTVISTLSGIAGVLLTFFVVFLVAYVIVRMFEGRAAR